MLEAARRGQDTSPYWVDGEPKQRLFNVLNYEVMSERPLESVVAEYLPGTIKLLEIDGSILEEELAEADKKAQEGMAELQNKKTEWAVRIATLEKLNALGPPPRDADIETLKQWDDNVEQLMPHKPCTLCENGARHLTLDQAIGWQRMVEEGDPGGTREELKAKRLAAARLEHDDEFRGFESRLREGKLFLDMEAAETKRLSAPVEAARAAIQKHKNRIEGAKAQLSRAKGVVYKVRVDSTNKGGIEIHNLWSVAVIRDGDKLWRVSFLYDEGEFAEQNADSRLTSLLMIAGAS